MTTNDGHILRDHVGWGIDDAIGLATEERAKAACRRRQVGCVIVSGGEIVGRGHNRSREDALSCLEGDCPRGLLTYGQQPAFKGYNNCIAIHAEEMALTEAGDRAKGSVVYVTCAPCPDCQARLDAAEVMLVIVEDLG